MDKYTVTLTCIYTTTVEAESFREAVNLADIECPYDSDGNGAWVINQTTGEEKEV